MTAIVDEYIDNLPEDRRIAIRAVREAVNAKLPPGYEEGIVYGLISWFVPFTRLAETYNGQPLCVASLGAQKNHMALYLMSVYGSPELNEWFQKAWKATGKKLDMGKSCIRFKKLDDLALDVIGEAIAKVSVDAYVAAYEASRANTAEGKKAAEGKAAAAKAKAKEVVAKVESTAKAVVAKASTKAKQVAGKAKQVEKQVEGKAKAAVAKATTKAKQVADKAKAAATKAGANAKAAASARGKSMSANARTASAKVTASAKTASAKAKTASAKARTKLVATAARAKATAKAAAKKPSARA